MALHGQASVSEVPSMEDAYAGYTTPQPPPRQAPPREPMAAQRNYPPHPNTYPGYRRRPVGPWLAIVLMLGVLGAVGAYFWFDANRETAEDLLGLEVDSYLQYLQEEQAATTDDDTLAVLPIDRATGSEGGVPPANVPGLSPVPGDR
jgi:hypothetical protein